MLFPAFAAAEFNSHVADYTKGKHLSGTHRYHNIITVGDVWQAGLYLPDDVTGEVKYKKCGTQPTPQHAAAAADHVAKLAGIQGRTPNFSCQKVADAVVAEVTKIGLDNGSLKSCGCGVIIISNRKTCIACIPPLEYLMVVKCNKVNPAYGDSYDARFQYFHDGKRCEIRIGGSRLQAEAAWQRDVFLRDELGMPADAVGVFNFKDQAAYMQARAQELQVRMRPGTQCIAGLTLSCCAIAGVRQQVRCGVQRDQEAQDARRAGRAHRARQGLGG